MSGLSDGDFYNLMQESINEVLEIHGENSLTAHEFLGHTLGTLENSMSTKFKSKSGSDIKTTLAQMRSWNQHIQDVHTLAAEESARTGTNISPSQYVENLKESGEWTKLIPSDVLKAAQEARTITDEKGKEIAWEDANEVQKYDAAVAYSFDLMQGRETMTARAEGVVREVAAAVEDAGGTDGTGLGPVVDSNPISQLGGQRDQANTIVEEAERVAQAETDNLTEAEEEHRKLLGEIEETRSTEGKDAVSKDILDKSENLGKSIEITRGKIKDAKAAKKRFESLIEKIDLELEAFKMAMGQVDPALLRLGEDLHELSLELAKTWEKYKEAGAEGLAILNNAMNHFLGIRVNLLLPKDADGLTVTPEGGEKPTLETKIPRSKIQNDPKTMAFFKTLLETLDSLPLKTKQRNALKRKINGIIKGSPTANIKDTTLVSLFSDLQSYEVEANKEFRNLSLIHI